MSVTFIRVADIHFHFLTHSFIKSNLDNIDGIISQASFSQTYVNTGTNLIVPPSIHTTVCCLEECAT